MEKMHKVELNQEDHLTVFGENTVVTRSSNGDPLSYLYHDSWNYIGEKNVAMHHVTVVSFTAIKSLDVRKKIQESLYKIQLYMDNFAVIRLCSIVSILHQLSLVLKHADWSKLSNNYEWKKLKKGLKGKYVSGTLENYQAVLNYLIKLYKIDRVIEPNELRSLASKERHQQHIALPIRTYQEVLKKCINTVETYHPYRHQISSFMAKAFEIKQRVEDGKSSYNPRDGKGSADSMRAATHRIITKELSHTIPGFKYDFLGTWINKVLIECLITCALFSGARLGELLSFNIDSYTVKETSNGDISVIQGQTSKGNNGIVRTDTWQCHPIVKDALELAHDMTEFARGLYKVRINQLFDDGAINEDDYNRRLGVIKLSFISPRVINMNSETLLSKAADKTNKFLSRLNFKATLEDIEEFDLLNDTRVGQLKLGGTLPKLSPHDFRRSFAVFMKRHGLGNAQTIKFQYKHKNIEMSEYYAKNAQLANMNDVLLDEELISFMEQEGIRMGVDAYDEIYNKSQHLSGIEGGRILGDKFERMKSGQKVYMNRSEIESLVRNGSLSLVMLPTGGYCTNSSCERLCGIKEFVAEKSICQYQIVTDKAAKKQAKYRERLIKKFDAMNNGDEVMNHILSGLKQSIIMVESTLDEHEIPYQPFIAKIKGCYV
jgi:hypothetical protein